ncbi:hypothetical protein E5288_WYG019327 [Bos mutus]|uniref:Uncharacterized protein n=1 Tax=Bos mutus TaxID=72004 RepID=A0A6B0RCC4_9CETA|nr:hypothetical protein [Bos mutus]
METAPANAAALACGLGPGIEKALRIRPNESLEDSCFVGTLPHSMETGDRKQKNPCELKLPVMKQANLCITVQKHEGKDWCRARSTSACMLCLVIAPADLKCEIGNLKLANTSMLEKCTVKKSEFHGIFPPHTKDEILQEIIEIAYT